eukprot:TRINITY_DN28758_c0_g1_i3.p1 TRINITY_DN28758_c0_g1~~TRINITY_DN28758_c0_g1_i3.p1  ORF type:complete len:326 (+),score=41.95 TRINITY_DN28758_c0_g1_i3:55-1032(+)
MAAKLKILVTRARTALPLEAVTLLEKSCEVTYHTEDKPIPRDNLIQQIQGKDGLFCLLTDKIDAPILDSAGDSLKVVATMSVGTDHLDIKELHSRQIKIGYTPDVLTDATADLAVALLLVTSRRLIEGNKALRSGDWSSWSPLWLCGPGLSGSTVGIVGLGRIGLSIMERLRPFGVGKFVYSGRSRKPESVENGAEFVPFDNLVESADFVVISTAYTEQMRHLFNKSVFDRMKPSSVLINISRGGIINQEDLYTALKQNKIFAAGLDVMEPEPLPTDHPLTTLDNCVLIPHLGSAQIQTRNLMADMTVKNILNALQGETMPAELK